jgi:ABC-type hemin transport system ATPase subunit
VLRPEILQDVFEIRVLVDAHPVSGAPRVTPIHEPISVNPDRRSV